MNDKEAVLLAADLIRTVTDNQTGIKKLLGKMLNKVIYIYYKSIKGEEDNE